MDFMADKARKAFYELPPRQPRRLTGYNMVRALGDRARVRMTTVWLHELHGDPITGKTKRQYREELGYDKDQEQVELERVLEKKLPPELEVEVTIENPNHRGMPLTYLEGLSDLEFTASSQTVKVDVVIIRWEVQGTHSATLLGVPPTGRHISLAGITWIAFEQTQNADLSNDVRATDEWTYWDLPSLMEQIGASP
jgi:predicted ester cyclase